MQSSMPRSLLVSNESRSLSRHCRPISIDATRYHLKRAFLQAKLFFVIGSAVAVEQHLYRIFTLALTPRLLGFDYLPVTRAATERIILRWSSSRRRRRN